MFVKCCDFFEKPFTQVFPFEAKMEFFHSKYYEYILTLRVCKILKLVEVVGGLPFFVAPLSLFPSWRKKQNFFQTIFALRVWPRSLKAEEIVNFLNIEFGAMLNLVSKKDKTDVFLTTTC